LIAGKRRLRLNLQAAVAYAWSKGAVIVAAAGDYGQGTAADKIAFPAAYPNVLAVGATDMFDARTPWSSYGAQLV
jgi:thermitase